jgi:hypothetical protein
MEVAPFCFLTSNGKLTEHTDHYLSGHGCFIQANSLIVFFVMWIKMLLAVTNTYEKY